MIPEPFWVPDDVLHLLHDRQVELFGGLRGVTDHNVVISSLFRPQFRWQYEPGADLADLAAAYLCGFAQKQGFRDGNKRTAAAVCLAFLARNGYGVHVPQRELYWAAISAAKDEMGEQEIAEWLRRRMEPARAQKLPPGPVRTAVLRLERAAERLRRRLKSRGEEI